MTARSPGLRATPDRAVPIPAVAPPVRRATAVLAGLAAGGLVVLAALYAGVEGPSALDTRIDPIVRDAFAADRVLLRRLVNLGSPRWLPILLALLVTLSLALRRPRIAVAAIVGVALTALGATVLQPAIGRTLDGGFALPSGHTGGAVAITAAATLLAVSLLGRWPRAAAVGAALALVAVTAVVGAGLIVNRLHYTTDVLAGACLATAAVLGAALLVDRVATHRSGGRIGG